MRRVAPIILIGLVLSMAAACAGILDLEEEFDDQKAIDAVMTAPDVAALRVELDALKGRLIQMKERNMLALFGEPAAKPEKTYALPVGQSRMLALSDFRFADEAANRDHVEFHTAGDAGAVQVYYPVDGISPEAVVVYLRADDAFPKLTGDNLAARVDWERDKLKKLIDFLDARRAEVFVWEIDPEAEAELYEGDYAVDPKVKLKAWLEAGNELNYRYTYRSLPGERHLWHGFGGAMTREGKGPKHKDLDTFIWYQEDGKRELRGERGRRLVSEWRWFRPGTDQLVRTEASKTGDWRPDEWVWYDENSEPIRTEWDDNGDGIPDWVKGPAAEVQEQLLAPADSWAVHPDLIPEANRITDQPERRVPVRRIGGAAEDAK